MANYELQSGWEISAATLDPNDHKRVFLTTDDLGNGNQETVLVHGLISEQGVQMVGVQSASFRTGFTPIRMIQYVADPSAGDASPLLNEVVTVHGRVTALDGPNYYFIQDDDGGPWDGLYIYVARQDSHLKIRDVVTVSGQVREYIRTGYSRGQTELGYMTGIDWFQYTPSWTDPVVNTINTTQARFRGSYTPEQYEDCLVRLNSAIVDSLAGRVGPYFGEWLLRQQGVPDTAQMDINGVNGSKGYRGCIGDILNLTGILGYDYGTYWVWPRSDRGNDIQVIYDNPACAPVGVEEEQALLAGPNLHGAPNPFNPKTSIRFDLRSDETVGLAIVDPSGRIVRTLLEKVPLKSGAQQVAWDGRDDAGRPVGTGAYFARLQSARGTIATKLILLK